MERQAIKLARSLLSRSSCLSSTAGYASWSTLHVTTAVDASSPLLSGCAPNLTAGLQDVLPLTTTPASTTQHSQPGYQPPVSLSVLQQRGLPGSLVQASRGSWQQHPSFLSATAASASAGWYTRRSYSSSTHNNSRHAGSPPAGEATAVSSLVNDDVGADAAACATTCVPEWGSAGPLTGSMLGSFVLPEGLVSPEAWSPAEGSGGAVSQLRLMHILHEMARVLQDVHDMTGLPWWASIPLTTFALKLALLPLSMWQAKTVRTNWVVYREAVALTDKQLGLSDSSLGPQPSPAGSSSSTSISHLDAAERIRRGRAILTNFRLLRTRLGAPHPAWILINPMLQIPAFLLVGVTLRMMGSMGWPGFRSEGALWFPDLTQAAMVCASFPSGPYQWPMGAEGPLLPLIILGITLTSIRLGFGAAGAQGSGTAPASAAGDWVGRVVRILPPLMYTLAVANLWVKLQQPHAALLHWGASASFTLSLQLALQRPALRALFQMTSPQQLQEALARASNQRLQQLLESGGALGPGRGYAVSSLPDSVVKQVSQEQSPDVLVIMGAQHSAQKRYREALYCLDRALQLDPSHIRGHYSRGQVFSLANRWADAEACFRRAADLARSPSEKGQALYCLATALHTQGRLDQSVPVYQEALELWSGQQGVITFSLANALLQLNRPAEALKLVRSTLEMEGVPASALGGPAAAPGEGVGQGRASVLRGSPFVQPLLQLAAKCEKQLKNG